MLSLSRIFKTTTNRLPQRADQSLRFHRSHVFLTKVGRSRHPRGSRRRLRVLDAASIDGFTKRSNHLKLFDENYRVYQYLFKRNNETFLQAIRQSDR